MIVFRLGRLGLNDEIIKQFFSSIFEIDDNVSKGEIDLNLHALRKTVLWRECAISASFVGEESIELDYIEKMLKYKRSQYNLLYDLINRTHTLLYYGDLVMADDGIINLQDAQDDGNFDCRKACLKRITRLSKLNDCKTAVNDMEPNDKRVYYFRAFDIATLYCFISSRGSLNKLPWLGEKEKDIIKDFRTEFVGISERRKKLLDEIKEETIRAITE